MDKKDGGKIEKWQIHHLQIPEGGEEKFKEVFPNIIFQPIVFTGTVVNEPTGRWKPGDHMRSSYIVSFDKKTGIVETLNTIYKLDMDTEGLDIVPDLGNGVLNLFY